MGNKASWIAPLGICLVCLFLAPTLANVGNAGTVLIVLAGGSGLAALVAAVRGRARPFRGRYDLGELREVDERLNLEALNEELGQVSDQADEVFCVRCGRAYRARFPVCPFCGHTP